MAIHLGNELQEKAKIQLRTSSHKTQKCNHTTGNSVKGVLCNTESMAASLQLINDAFISESISSESHGDEGKLCLDEVLDASSKDSNTGFDLKTIKNHFQMILPRAGRRTQDLRAALRLVDREPVRRERGTKISTTNQNAFTIRLHIFDQKLEPTWRA